MVEIEVNDGRNGDLLFHPTGERCRGRFDAAKVNAPELGTLVRDLPHGVPGMVIQFDPATNTGRVVDPLHDPAHAATKAAIERRLVGQSAFGGAVDFGTAEKRYENAHAGSWLGWMARAVKAGAAKLVRGKLPDSDPPDMRRGFYHHEKADPKDATIAHLVAFIASKMSATDRRELAGVLGAAGVK